MGVNFASYATSYASLRITELSVPEDINDYLLGIGDVTDYNGVPWTLKLGVELNATPVNGLQLCFDPRYSGESSTNVGLCH